MKKKKVTILLYCQTIDTVKETLINYLQWQCKHNKYCWWQIKMSQLTCWMVACQNVSTHFPDGRISKCLKSILPTFQETVKTDLLFTVGYNLSGTLPWFGIYYLSNSALWIHCIAVSYQFEIDHFWLKTFWFWKKLP